MASYSQGDDNDPGAGTQSQDAGGGFGGGVANRVHYPDYEKDEGALLAVIVLFVAGVAAATLLCRDARLLSFLTLLCCFSLSDDDDNNHNDDDRPFRQVHTRAPDPPSRSQQ